MIGLSSQAQQTYCPNLNFGMGNFTNWQCYLGSCESGIANISPSNSMTGRHTIMNYPQLLAAGQLFDERCVNIRKVPNGFTYAAKLGNEVSGSEMEGLEYTLTVDSSNSLLLVYFAWVMEDPGHTPEEQPRFTLTVKDSVGNSISSNTLPCAFYEFKPSADLDGLICTGDVFGRDWTTVGYSLEPMIGRTIKIYFETRDCSLGSHYGYTYIVAECRPITIDLIFNEGQFAARFRAPDGFQRYTWTRSIGQMLPNSSGVGKQFQNLTLPDAFDGEIVTCEMESALNSECSITIHTIVKKTSIDATFGYGIMEDGEVDFISNNNQNCYDTCNRTVTFVDRSKVVNSKQASRLWMIHGLNQAIPNDSMVTVTFPDPGLQGLDSIQYLVRLTVVAENGSVDTSENLQGHYITIYASPKVNIASFSKGSSAYAKAIPVQGVFVNFTWSWEDANGIQQTVTGDSVQLQDTGIYMLVSESKGDCIIEKNLFRVTSSYQISELYTMEGVVVSSDGYPFSGANIYLSDSVSIFDSTITDASGAFSFLVESNASVTLTAKLAGYTFTPEFITCDSVTGNLSGQDFIAIIAESPFTSISGRVFRQNQTPLSSGLVSLYSLQTLSQYILTATVAIENDGTYLFADVQSGSYILKAVPASSENALPTYHGNTEIWNLASVVTAGNSHLQNMDISLIPIAPLNGNSFISGYVGEEGNGTQGISHKSVTYPVEDVCVYLQCWENSLWNTIAQTLSNVEGYFEFRNISAGRYRLILDVPGLTIDNPVVMDINEGDTIQDIEYEITETGINNNTVGITSFVKDENLKIYPNPVQNTLHLQSSSTIEQVSIYDISGRMLQQIANPSQEVNISHLANGIYLVKVKTAGGEVVKKIVKQ